jgi:ComF family protein
MNTIKQSLPRQLVVRASQVFKKNVPVHSFVKWGAAAVDLFFPTLCVACSDRTAMLNTCFCASCRARLIVQDMYKMAENEFTDRFWGRLPLQTGAALYKFSKKSPIQKAMHRLKYGNRPEIGRQLGREMGLKLKQSASFANVDAIVCVPLHPLRERKRGYNQSAMFAQGLAEAMSIPHLAGALQRKMYSESQTRKKRMERFDNVESVFDVAKPKLLQHKHILLVDDVLTTGATLEQCGKIILDVPHTKLSMATIAMAQR